MARECKKCGKKEGIFLKLDENGICESCRCEEFSEKWQKEKAQKAQEAEKEEALKAEQEAQEMAQKAEQNAAQKELQDKTFNEIKNIIVTTTDISEPYTVITPIIYNTSNRGVFSSLYSKLVNKYNDPLYKQLLISPELSPEKNYDIGLFLFSLFDASFQFEGSVGQGGFDRAFYMCVAEMKMRAYQLGGNAIIGMKMDFDLDTVNFSSFYLQMYGTVVKINR